MSEAKSGVQSGVQGTRFGRTETLLDERGKALLWWVIYEAEHDGDFVNGKRMAALAEHAHAFQWMRLPEIERDDIRRQEENHTLRRLLEKCRTELVVIADSIVSHDSIYRPLVNEIDNAIGVTHATET